MNTKTIEMVLYDGSLDGYTYLVMSSWNKGVLLSSHKSTLDQLLKTDEIERRGVYLLLSKNKVYVGQSRNIKQRISRHHLEKEWWDKVIVLTTVDNSFDNADIDYLEDELIKLAKLLGTLESDNKVSGIKSNPDRFKKIKLDQYLQESFLALKVVGVTLFDHKDKDPKGSTYHVPNILKKETTKRNYDNLLGKTYYYNLRGKDARIKIVSKNEIIVLKGSIIQDLKKFSGDIVKNALTYRTENENKGNLINEEVINDITFDSLSKAVIFIYGGNANAWTSFKDENGNTIDVISKQK